MPDLDTYLLLMRSLGMDAYKAVIEKRDKREFENIPIPEEILLKVLQATRRREVVKIDKRGES